MPKKKRIFTVSSFLESLGDTVRVLPECIRAYTGPGRMDAAFREQIMLSISRMNDCRYCTAIHGAWAEKVGLDEEQRAALVDLEPGSFDRRTWVALAWARRLVDDDAAPDPDLETELRAHYSEREIAAIKAVAIAINLANRSGNTWDAFLERLGLPVGKG